jgi:hypothetical protein
MSPRATDLALVHAAVLLFGFAGLFGKWLALPAAVIVLGRTVVAAAALAAIALARGRPARLRDVPAVRPPARALAARAPLDGRGGGDRGAG